jgi:hypothetical protein
MPFSWGSKGPDRMSSIPIDPADVNRQLSTSMYIRNNFVEHLAHILAKLGSESLECTDNAVLVIAAFIASRYKYLHFFSTAMLISSVDWLLYLTHSRNPVIVG